MEQKYYDNSAAGVKELLKVDRGFGKDKNDFIHVTPGGCNGDWLFAGVINREDCVGIAYVGDHSMAPDFEETCDPLESYIMNRQNFDYDAQEQLDELFEYDPYGEDY